MTTDQDREALLKWATKLDAIELWPDLSALLRSLAASSRDQIAEDFLKAHQGGVDAMARSLRSILDGGACFGSEPHELFEVAQRLAAQAVAPAEPGRKPTVPPEWKKAVQEAYGWLWHVNNEPMAPVPMWSPEQAAYEARKNLRELLTKDERGEAINAVSGMLRNKAEAHDIKKQP